MHLLLCLPLPGSCLTRSAYLYFEVLYTLRYWISGSINAPLHTQEELRALVRPFTAASSPPSRRRLHCHFRKWHPRPPPLIHSFVRAFRDADDASERARRTHATDRPRSPRSRSSSYGATKEVERCDFILGRGGEDATRSASEPQKGRLSSVLVVTPPSRHSD